ncbi:LUD domain-containing protein [Maribacter hydrothermalis]|uniref:Lactate utilization protein B/C n=1 Tax=Maribacter hydrothermalis TaxID=1836467 RepID=A0A1B7ZBE3_9FLAO|nr:LUD domain-containing protein [Maribacter hydrothermalis]APQ16467.1 lactate utilization protein B/C [Maribacter hydrothermalis]OBR40031.1 lactate utilization protein B/C [Maribacter hydrothermalis]
MGLLDILFGGGKKKVSKETAETRGDHMPDLNIPVDEKFTIHFKQNGGKFIYCISDSEISGALQSIIEENNWQKEPFYVLNKRLAEKFSKEGIVFTEKIRQSEVFFTTCEHLIAQNGSILVCSNQLHEKKVNELPSNVVVFATTSQLVESIGEGLKTIKKKYGQKIPANITTLKHFKATKENSDDFLTYGSSTKNLYLLLLEDL